MLRTEPWQEDLGNSPCKKQSRPISLSMSHNHVLSQTKPNYLQSLDLDPIEQIWAELKNQLYRSIMHSTGKSLA